MMTKDIRFQIECLSADLVLLLMEEYGWDMKRSFDELYTSQTYERLNDPDCCLYSQGAVYIFQFLKNEIETGKVA